MNNDLNMPPRRRPKSKARASEHSSDDAGDGKPQAAGSASTDQRDFPGLSRGFPLTSADQASTGPDRRDTMPESQQEALPPRHRQNLDSRTRSWMGAALAQESAEFPVELPVDPWQAHRRELSQEESVGRSNATAMSAASLSEIPNKRLREAMGPGSHRPSSTGAATAAQAPQSSSHITTSRHQSDSQIQHPPNANLTMSTQRPRQQRLPFSDNSAFEVVVVYSAIGQNQQQTEHLGLHIGPPRAQAALNRFLAQPAMLNRRVLITTTSRLLEPDLGYKVIDGPLQGRPYDIQVRMHHVGDQPRRVG